MIAPGLHEPAPDPDDDWRLRWPNFSPHEFQCKCHGRFCNRSYFHDPEFLDALQIVRFECGPLVINSGHRCHQWNKHVGGARKSQHLKIAADISLLGHDRHALLESVRRAGFRGIGFGESFLHVDRRATGAEWDYGHASRVAWGLSV